MLIVQYRRYPEQRFAAWKGSRGKFRLWGPWRISIECENYCSSPSFRCQRVLSCERCRGLFASPSERYQVLIFFEIKSILRHRREVFVASPVSIEFQVNARLLPSLITSKLRKKSTVMRADSDDFVCVCVSWRVSRRDQIYG
jgi:hypothetical protein